MTSRRMSEGFGDFGLIADVNKNKMATLFLQSFFVVVKVLNAHYQHNGRLGNVITQLKKVCR